MWRVFPQKNTVSELVDYCRCLRKRILGTEAAGAYILMNVTARQSLSRLQSFMKLSHGENLT